ncbi:Uncharacterized conserved protein, contains GH25 family domain [Sulfitobacter brevis]|uniref:Uncharacterized conserved protein, contains GH25 family domain n=2 Tax=Sulfitobacter brevis TaxID=74348 RepID=A0A1I1UU08_9RHOB|nr:Uncharacterized conserved protein, contains GH25 family domain [Sulfitobacter brevis]
MKVFVMSLSRCLFFIGLTLPLTPAFAHEYWIAPHAYQVAPGAAIQADFRNGQEFEGVSLAYFSNSSARYEAFFDNHVAKITPRLGDSPAFQMNAPDGEGLLSVIYETTASTVTYKEWEKFLAFAKHKDFPQAEQQHIDEGWRQENFKETYTRHTKALIAVGGGKGADAARGMETEFVALTNPYTDDLSSGMKVALSYQNQPRANAQVEVFDRAPDETVSITLHRTDAEGIATIPVTAGHEYLFDGVVLRKAEKDARDPAAPVWETLWAALTFKVPE